MVNLIDRAALQQVLLWRAVAGVLLLFVTLGRGGIARLHFLQT